MTSEHLPLLCDLDADADVLRFILGRARTADEALEYWEPICADTAADALGLGWWIGWRHSDGEFIGWWDLSPDPSPDELRAQAGWRLARQHWGRGYATEGATAVLEYGFTAIGLNVVSAEAMAVNLASRRVMAKLGMRHIRTDHRDWEDPLPGTDQGEVVYEIRCQDWTRS